MHGASEMCQAVRFAPWTASSKVLGFGCIRMTTGQWEVFLFFLSAIFHSQGKVLAKSTEHSYTEKARNVRDWLNYYTQPVQEL